MQAAGTLADCMRASVSHVLQSLDLHFVLTMLAKREERERPRPLQSITTWQGSGNTYRDLATCIMTTTSIYSFMSSSCNDTCNLNNQVQNLLQFIVYLHLTCKFPLAIHLHM